MSRSGTTHRKRFLVHGANALLASLGSLGIAVIGYILVDRYRPFRIDMTASGLYELSPRTLGILEELKNDVRVTYFEAPLSRGSEASFVNDRVSELLEEYKVRSGGKVSYDVVNPLREPLLVEELVGEDNYPSAVFQARGEKVIVKGDEIFAANYASYDDGPAVTFTGEEAFSSAILRVVEGSTSVACFLQGHGEYSIDSEGGDGYSSIADSLRGSNFTTRETVLSAAGGGETPLTLDAPVPLGTPKGDAPKVEVPDDCTVLVIAGPTKGNLNDGEIDAIVRHWEKGRGVVLLAESLAKAPKTRTDVLVSKFGLTLQPGVVLDPKRMIQSPVLVVPDWEKHAITEVMLGEEIGAVIPDAAALKPAAEPESSLVLSALLTSSPASVVVVDIKDGRADPDSERNLPGPHTLGFAIERPVADGKIARAVVLGDADFATNAILQTFGAGNVLLAENVITWAAGSRKKLDIGPKDPGLAVIGPELTSRGALWILFSTALLIPAGILSSGAFIFLRRRSR